MRSNSLLKLVVTALSLVALGAFAAGCGDDKSGSSSSTSSSSNDAELNLVAYSTPQEAYEAIIPAFQKTPGGNGVTFKQSYGASGDQERAIEAGLDADVAALSLQPDIDKLVKAKLVADDWNKDSSKGFVTNSVVVLATRKGNPKNIKTWEDLAKPGVEVVTPNPFTSGGARWNILSIYGSQLKQGKTKAEALAFVEKVLKNVVVQDKSARESLQTFNSGKGDVLLAYENEAITGQNKGLDLDYTVPDQTILIQNPAAVIEKSKHPVQAKAFLDYLHSDAGQKLYASKGYRPVVKSLVDTKKFPTPKQLFDIEYLGGWKKINDEFFDPQNGEIAKIYQNLGVSTAKN